MKKIFLVHDEQENPGSRASFLEMSGFQVELMQSADECLQRIGTETPDVVVMDVLLQGRTGFELCRQLRMTYGPEQLPIILMSLIYRGRTFREEAMSCGAQHYFLRPMKLDELALAVNLLTGNIGGAAA